MSSTSPSLSDCVVFPFVAFLAYDCRGEEIDEEVIEDRWEFPVAEIGWSSKGEVKFSSERSLQVLSCSPWSSSVQLEAVSTGEEVVILEDDGVSLGIGKGRCPIGRSSLRSSCQKSSWPPSLFGCICRSVEGDRFVRRAVRCLLFTGYACTDSFTRSHASNIT